MIYTNKIFAYLLLIIAFAITYSCDNVKPNNIDTIEKIDDYKKVKQRGVLRVAINTNSTDYFIYRGQAMGYQLELIQDLAKSLNLKLMVVVENNLHDIFIDLNTGLYDIAAIGLTITKDRSEIVSFTKPIGQTKQVLIQRKPKSWRNLSKRQLQDSLIREPLQLANKTIYIQKKSAFKKRLQSLSDEIGSNIYINESDSLEVEDLILQVSKGIIDYTVCDKNVARVNRLYYSNIDVETAISFNQNLAWATSHNSTTLLDTINAWLTEYKKTKKYKYLYQKYFNNSRSSNIKSSKYYFNTTNKISEYDDIIKKEAKKLHWNWKLLASLIYQESRFNHNAKSWAGAFGIMQLMPETAEAYNVDSSSSDIENIIAGVKFLKFLDNWLIKEIPNKKERQKFVVASYNVGLGHILDARRLAEKYGKNKNIWDNNVDCFLRDKSKPKYYNDTCVRYGYCRGYEPYNYVKDIFDRLSHYNSMANNTEFNRLKKQD